MAITVAVGAKNYKNAMAEMVSPSTKGEVTEPEGYAVLVGTVNVSGEVGQSGTLGMWSLTAIIVEGEDFPSPA